MSVSTIYTGTNGNIRVQGTLDAAGLAVKAGLGTDPAQLSLIGGPASGVSSQYILAVGGSDPGFAVDANQFVLNSFNTATGVLRDQLLATAPGSGSGVPSAANPSLISLTGAQQSGLAQIAPGASTVVVPLTGIQTTGVVVITQYGTLDATATSFRVSAITAGTSFTIAANANATAACDIWWFVVRLS
jgi:hypothetical protein